jgi:hypothetical protein
MLIVTCQKCGEYKVLAGAPDGDGLARTCWICSCCGSGQVVQLEVSAGGGPEDAALGMKPGIEIEVRVKRALAELGID